MLKITLIYEPDLKTFNTPDLHHFHSWERGLIALFLPTVREGSAALRGAGRQSVKAARHHRPDTFLEAVLTRK